MNTLLKAITIGAGAALALFAGGCSTASMKGTPFYSGEYAKRLGPDEHRVNAWPLLYYRDPALSVLWPIFELTDDHTAVRPLFSVYGLDASNREYNVLWPLSQIDRQSGESYVFPLFWSSNHLVVFPLYWHYGQPWGTNGGSDSVFPLWVLSRKGTNELSVWALWPLVHYARDGKVGEESSMVFPLYWHGRDPKGSLFVSIPWMSGHDSNSRWQVLTPLFYHRTNDLRSVLVTPLWAQGRSPASDWQAIIPLVYWDRQQHTLLSALWANWQSGDRETFLAPWSLSWATRRPERTDLWLASALAHASWGEKPGSHYVLPLYYRDAADHTLLTPVCGWSGSGDYYYPLTPLAGVRTGRQSGSWVFPIYSLTRDTLSGDRSEHVLLLGGYAKAKQHTHAYFYPLFSRNNYGPLESTPEPRQRYGHYGNDFWCLPFCWYENECHVRPPGKPAVKENARPAAPAGEPTFVRTYSQKNGAFPFWSYAAESTPLEGRQTVKSSVLVRFYDYKHEAESAPRATTGPTNDYTRARVCGRLWHYERSNGDVSVDVFPAFTYDRKTDGFKKTSLLWRLFRYERDADGAKKLDALFVPLKG